MVECPHCNTANSPESPLCVECGGRIREESQRVFRTFRRNLLLLLAGTGIFTAGLVVYAVKVGGGGLGLGDQENVVLSVEGATGTEVVVDDVEEPDSRPAAGPATGRTSVRPTEMPRRAPSVRTPGRNRPPARTGPPARSGETVYLADYGDYYHDSDCRRLRRYRREISREDALAHGLKPCPLCEPP